LTTEGIGTESAVGLLMGRSRELAVGMIAALYAGAAMLPLDPWQPPARLATIAADAAPATILTTADIIRLGDMPAGPSYLPVRLSAPETQPRLAAGAMATHPQALAYMLYTSGSTGAPKGVGCTHAGLLNMLAEVDRLAPLGPNDRCAWWTSPGFDVTMYEVFAAFRAGAALITCPDDVHDDADRFAAWLAAQRITSAYVPPHLLPGLAQWAADHPGRTALRRVLVGVEPIPEPLLRQINRMAPGLVIVNGYGPTEATV
ncbi:MAG: AMP-binding protein, partial [Mycobacteriales bacterium]